MTRGMWSGAVLAAALAVAAHAADEKVAWEKNPETAMAKAAATGKPVCMFFLTEEGAKGPKGG